MNSDWPDMLGEQVIFIIRAFVSLNYNLVFERTTQKFISANKNSYGNVQMKVWWKLDEKFIRKWWHQWCLHRSDVLIFSVQKWNPESWEVLAAIAGLKISKTWFRNNSWPERSTQWVGQLFGWVLRPQTHMGSPGATPIFGPTQGPKNRKWKIRPKTRITHNQSIDNSLLSSHEKSQPDWSKMAE